MYYSYQILLYYGDSDSDTGNGLTELSNTGNGLAGISSMFPQWLIEHVQEGLERQWLEHGGN